MRVLFYAPMKPADHPAPSGDREMARLLIAALERAGFIVEIASRLRMHDSRGDAERTRGLAAQAGLEAVALVDAIRRRAEQERPTAFFTYHVHYKAPDVIGPAVARTLGIPYVVAEGSRAPKRANGPWAEGHRLAEAALDAADCVFVMNERDREVLERLAPVQQRLVALPPFIDPAGWPDMRDVRLERPPGGPVRLLTVAMMREGDKLASYRILAQALASLPSALDWTLDVVGDGPAYGSVQDLLQPFGTRAKLAGVVYNRVFLAEIYGTADILVWPAVNEAYGMIFLEAALQGCPSLAGRFGGVPGVVIDGVTGRLVQGGDADAFAATLADLIGDAAQRRTLGGKAARFVREERTLEGAAKILRTALRDLAANRESAAG